MPHSILLIESDNHLRSFWKDALTKEGFQVTPVATEEEAIKRAQISTPELVFLGTGLEEGSGIQTLQEIRKFNENILVISPTNPEALKEELKAIEAHGTDYSNRQIQIDQVKIAIKNAIELQVLKEQTSKLADRETSKYSFGNIVGDSSSMKKVFTAISDVIHSAQTTVLICGETGTGKELVARAIHYSSNRAIKAFMDVVCTAVPETLLESELFGHEAGAFTDAKKTKKGLFEIADGGTIFLDEIGDMPLSIQGKVLKVIEEKRFRRLGGLSDIQVDVRVVAATNRDLSQQVSKGLFREDLYYRLKVFPIYLPPLRDRKEDIIPLAKHFIDHFNRELKKDVKGISFSAQKKLEEYEWPGNVRELRNIIERAVILAKGDLIGPEDIILEKRPAAERRWEIPEEGISLEDVEKNLVKDALDKANGNQAHAAKLLNISRYALRNRMKKFELQ